MVDTQGARLGEAVEPVPHGGHPSSMGSAGDGQGRDISWAPPTTGLLHPVRWSAKVVHAKRLPHSPSMSARGSVLPWGG
jgi:hypothetical protein